MWILWLAFRFCDVGKNFEKCQHTPAECQGVRFEFSQAIMSHKPFNEHTTSPWFLSRKIGDVSHVRILWNLHLDEYVAQLHMMSQATLTLTKFNQEEKQAYLLDYWLAPVALTNTRTSQAIEKAFPLIGLTFCGGLIYVYISNNLEWWRKAFGWNHVTLLQWILQLISCINQSTTLPFSLFPMPYKLAHWSFSKAIRWLKPCQAW